MAFTAIEPADGLTPSERRRAAWSGPNHVLVRTSYASLLRNAGFVGVERRDRTAAYRVVQQRWIDATLERFDEIAATLGEEAAEQRLSDRRGSLAAIDAGLLQRWEYLAHRPSDRRPASARAPS